MSSNIGKVLVNNAAPIILLFPVFLFFVSAVTPALRSLLLRYALLFTNINTPPYTYIIIYIIKLLFFISKIV